MSLRASVRNAAIGPAASTSAAVTRSTGSEHQTRWWAGSNLFDDWKSETEEQQRAGYDDLDFSAYREVEPVYPVLVEAGT